MGCRQERERPERDAAWQDLSCLIITKAIPAGVTKSSTPYVTQSTPPWHNFGPRLGFAWQPTSSSRFVVRGRSGNLLRVRQRSSSCILPAAGYARLSERAKVATGKLGAARSTSGRVSGTSRRLRVHASVGRLRRQGRLRTFSRTWCRRIITTPLTYEWNLNTQYEFVRNWVLELGYVGSHGIRQEQGGAVANATNWNSAQLASPASPVNGVTTNTAANVNLRAPFPWDFYNR